MLHDPLIHFVKCDNCNLHFQTWITAHDPRKVYDFGDGVLLPVMSHDWWCCDCNTVSQVEEIPSEGLIREVIRQYTKSIDEDKFLGKPLLDHYRNVVKNEQKWIRWASQRDDARCLSCGCQHLVPLDQESLRNGGNLNAKHPGCGGNLFTRTEPAPRSRCHLFGDPNAPIFFSRFNPNGLIQYNYLESIEKEYTEFVPLIISVVEGRIKAYLSGKDMSAAKNPSENSNAKLAKSLGDFVADELEGTFSLNSSVSIKSEFPDLYSYLCLYVRQQVANAKGVRRGLNDNITKKTPSSPSMKQTALHKNPFHLLGVTTRDSRLRIVEQAEEHSLHIDHELCQKARSALINPRTRLPAEMAWMPGVAPRMADKLTTALSDDPLTVRSANGLPDLARANVIAAAFEFVKEYEPAEIIAELIRDFAWLVEYIDAEEVLRDINEDRAISGFPEVKGVDLIEGELNERRKAYRSVLKDLLDSMDPNKLVETMTDTVAVATNGGEDQGPALIDELVDTYEIETQGFLQKEYDNIVKLVESAREAAPHGEKAVAPIVDKLGKVARNWDRVAQPIQLSAKSRGIVHRPSRDVAYELRSLGIELNNEHGMLEQAHRMTELLQELFAELPEVVEKLGEDAETIAGLRRQAQEKEMNQAQWERDITFRTEIGVMFKDELSISPEGIHWKGKLYPLEAITRVRWGGVRNSVNGIPTGTDYTIGFGDNRTEQVIQLKKESTYSEFLAALWKGVCVRMMYDMVAALEEGRAFGLGDMKVEDGAVTLTKHKFLGSNETVRLPWHYVHVWSGDGSFFIGKQDDKKTYGSSSYINNWNTHLLEHIIRGGFKKGVSKLSDYLKD